jgi:effector-binding domain-containing protein
MTEQQPYEVLEKHPDFELRRYPAHVVAETSVTGSFEGVGNSAFRRLAGFIGGRNSRSQKVAMTAPVVQEAEDEAAGRYLVAFVMPAGLDLADAPEPSNPDVRLRSVPPHTAAARRFSGRWSRRSYDENTRRLLAAVATAGLEVDGPVRYARFDPPWTPWFLRRNEVLVPVRR